MLKYSGAMVLCTACSCLHQCASPCRIFQSIHVTIVYLQGLVRNIGISNFSIQKTQEVLSFCRIRPAVNQVHA